MQPGSFCEVDTVVDISFRSILCGTCGGRPPQLAEQKKEEEQSRKMRRRKGGEEEHELDDLVSALRTGDCFGDATAPRARGGAKAQRRRRVRDRVGVAA